MGLPFSVRLATEADIPAMVAVMGAVFQDGDPFGEFMFPDEKQRSVRQPRILAAMIKYRYIPQGGAEVAVTDDGRIVGVVLWTKSWVKQNVLLKVKEDLALLAAMKSRVIAGLTAEAAVARGKPKDRHLYVMYIGIDEAFQGYGATQSLFGSVRECAVTEEVGVYFNCKKSLIPFYLDAIPEATLTGTTTLGKRGPAIYFLYGQRAQPT